MRRSQTPRREADVLAACRALLTLRGIPHWRQNSGALRVDGRFVRFGLPGCSDLIGILPRSGRLIACEVKRPGGQLTAAQRAFLDAVNAAGGVGIVVEDVKVLARVLDRLMADPWAAIDGPD